MKLSDGGCELYEESWNIEVLKIKMSYIKLWKLLIGRDMKKSDLRTQAEISLSSLAKRGKDENTITDMILGICGH